ncbi:hypothetical protein ANANG_G00274420 [Anguilla anguilla]|uniref:Uncharacterized protein n=1 Tax=Anguilla anguilla TaxID=7936 RepID=A0A9D3RK46_ANGAN|nr:hypothetical protein ANANG_G00274420 [Anguilla anguilla]
MSGNNATCYVVRKIAASAAKEDQDEQPVFTPCSLALAKKRDRLAAVPTADLSMTSDPSVDAGPGTAPPETVVQKCSS